MSYDKIKKQTTLYSPIPTQCIFDNSQNCSLQRNKYKAIITIGLQTPYKYQQNFHPEAYMLFLEGLNIHQIASLLFTDIHIFNNIYQSALCYESLANISAKAFLDNIISYNELKSILLEYLYAINLPLILQAIEDGAIENSMGIKYPETWNALMFARQIMTKYFINHINQTDHTFLIDKIIQEIMIICTYGYKYSLKNEMFYLKKYLPDQFKHIRKLAIKGRLQTQNTSQRKDIAKQILSCCQPIIDRSLKELIHTIRLASTFSNIPNSLFSSAKSEIALNLQNNDTQYTPESTQSKYKIDISDEEFERIEQLEDQNEKQQQYELFQEIHKREQNTLQKQEKNNQKKIEDNSSLQNQIIHAPLQRNTPTQYGMIAYRSQKESIIRSNKLAKLLKREQMCASKSIVKHRKDYGHKLDQLYLYRATLDGRIFMEHKKGEKKDLCVYILVDTSESMSGQKIINTMKGCYELARVLQTLHIPFCISAHKSLGHTQIQMTNIISFQECKKRNVLDRIYCMHVSGGTHEEIALEYVLKELVKYKKQRKGFVFVLSDGDTHGVDRIHLLTKYYKKQWDVDVIGIGIQTAPLIETTYPQAIYVEDIQTLPDVLIKKLKEIAI